MLETPSRTSVARYVSLSQPAPLLVLDRLPLVHLLHPQAGFDDIAIKPYRLNVILQQLSQLTGRPLENLSGV